MEVEGEEKLGAPKRVDKIYVSWTSTTFFFPLVPFVPLLGGGAKTRMGRWPTAKKNSHAAPPFGGEQGLSAFIGSH